jgi:hypothetical protein
MLTSRTLWADFEGRTVAVLELVNRVEDESNTRKMARRAEDATRAHNRLLAARAQ